MQHWDDDEEREKERRLQERRQRVQERVAAQKQRGSAAGDGLTDGAQHQGKGKHEAQLGLEAVKQLREQCDAAVAIVRDQAEQREEQRREQWDQQAAWLKDEIASEAEFCKQHNRAIDLEWEAVHNSTAPQQAHEAMLAVRQHCEQVLQSKDALIAGIKGVLRERDDAYTRLLQGQTEETDGLIALMAQEHDRFRRGQEQVLEAVEAAWLQERGELISAHKAELNALLEKRSALEQSFMDQYLKACEAYEAQLEAMRVAESEEYTALKRRLEGEVASLRAHLDSMQSVYMLNADKLHYNVRVLSERERENKEALQQQKRKITHQWEVLAKIKKRFAAMDIHFVEENMKLADEYQRVTRAFNHLQSKYRHFKAADLQRFGKIRAMKEAEMEQLVEKLAELDSTIRQHVLGLHVYPTADSAPPEALELAVVGRAVTSRAEVPSGSTAGIAASVVGLGVDQEPEVFVMAGGEAAERGQLIGAYRPADAGDAPGPPGKDEPAERGHSWSWSCDPTGLMMTPLAWQELRGSLDAGVLSLLVGSGGRVDGPKVLQLLQQLPVVEPGRWEAACVVRGLGLHHDDTKHAVEQLLCSEDQEAAEAGGVAGTVLPRAQVGAEGLTGTVMPRGQVGAEEGAGAACSARQGAALVGAKQVQQGLQRMVDMLSAEASGQSMHSTSSASGAGAGGHASPRAPGSAAGPGQQSEATSTAYWRCKVHSVVPPEVFKTWALLEPQLARHFKLLKSRSKTADEVAALKRENELLKSRLRERLTSPVNDELQLPTRILLQ